MSENLKKASTTDELARERNRAAADRTLMAWIRTVLAMIGFGFGVGKLYDALEKANPEGTSDPLYSAQIVGEALIVLGVLGLLAAVIQHWRILNQIEDEQFIYRPLRLADDRCCAVAADRCVRFYFYPVYWDSKNE